MRARVGADSHVLFGGNRRILGQVTINIMMPLCGGKNDLSDDTKLAGVRVGEMRVTVARISVKIQRCDGLSCRKFS